jgi:hypothetical protein
MRASLTSRPPSLDIWEIAYLVCREADGTVMGSAQIQLQRRSLCQNLFVQLQEADERAAIAELRRRSMAWVADWYARPDTGATDLSLWSRGWGQ